MEIYSNCYENIELEDGSRKIVITETLEDFISEKTDDIKWDFREKLDLENVINKFYNLPEEEIKDEEIEDEFIYTKDGKVEYVIFYFHDEMRPLLKHLQQNIV